MSNSNSDDQKQTPPNQGTHFHAERDIDIEVAGDMVSGDKIQAGGDVTKVTGDNNVVLGAGAVQNVYYVSETAAEAPKPKPRIAFEPELVEVPAGTFLMGSDAEDAAAHFEAPSHFVELDRFWIAKYPITHHEYAEYLRQTKQRPPKTADWFLQDPVPEKKDHPVVNVSWEDAQGYCAWLSNYAGQTYRLPTEAQWEKAARGMDGLRFPWGDEWVDGACHIAAKGTAAVTQYEAFASPFGCVGMLGNVQEWTRTQWGSDRHEPDYRYPYVINDGRDQEAVAYKTRRICRGFPFNAAAADVVRSTVRTHAIPRSATPFRGFRVVLEL